MPILHARTAKRIRANISKNIATEKRAHPRMKTKQAVAIGYSIARADAKKAHLRLKLGQRRRPSK